MSSALRRRHESDAGAAAVEFALMFPLFIMLTVGMISAGFAFERWIAVTQGAREAARYGATLDVTAVVPPGPATWVTDVADVAREASGVASSTPGQSVCVAIYYGGEWTRRSPSGLVDTGADMTFACWDDQRTDERVQVSLSRDTDFNWVFASKTISLNSRSATRYEHGVN